MEEEEEVNGRVTRERDDRCELYIEESDAWRMTHGKETVQEIVSIYSLTGSLRPTISLLLILRAILV